MIRCTRCQESKPESEFHKKLGGRQPQCKDCRKSYAKEHPQKEDDRTEYRDPEAARRRRLSKIDMSDPNACWLWRGTIHMKGGYGQTGGGKMRKYAHRAIWEDLVGPIPEEMTLDHECHNRDSSCTGGPTCLHRRCCNPKHLALKTIGDNLRSSPIVIENGRTLAQRRKR